MNCSTVLADKVAEMMNICLMTEALMIRICLILLRKEFLGPGNYDYYQTDFDLCLLLSESLQLPSLQ